MTYTEILEILCGTMTVSGWERNAHETVRQHFASRFDEITSDGARNLILLRRCQKENAPRILLDAHMDEIGMMVREVLEDGFLTVANVGGLDRQILPCAECRIYGEKKTVSGVLAVRGISPDSEGSKVPEWKDLVIDTGYTKEELTTLGIGPGSPVSYRHQWTQLLNNRITGQGFDDKCCAAGLLWAVIHTPREELAGDVYVVLSAAEEIHGQLTNCAALAIQPDFAIVTDVNFASTPGMASDESAPLGEGPMTSLSAATDRRLTDRIIAAAKKAEIPLHPVVESTNTGTNAGSLIYANTGVPTAVVSIPLAGMHSYNECLSIDDGEAFARLIRLCITSPDIGTDSVPVWEKGGLA